jgi:hypothetical protein
MTKSGFRSKMRVDFPVCRGPKRSTLFDVAFSRRPSNLSSMWTFLHTNYPKAFDLNYLVNLEDRRLQLAALWDMCIYCADVLPKLTMLFWSVA